MVKLTTAYVEKKCSQTLSNKSLTKEMEKDHLRKITHLHMNDKFIDFIDDFSACINLKVIYLQNNCIRKIENVNFAKNLTHLYLQRNSISKIENLENLSNLRTLYLGYNCIGVVEGLETLENLSDLQLEKQKLPVGESLCFEPRSASTLAKSLKILNVTGNRMASLQDIKHFSKLEILEARDNDIDDIEDLTDTISSSVNLTRIDFRGNPVTRVYRYKENLIANSQFLSTLDGKKVSEVSRKFLKSLQLEKHLRQTTKGSKVTLREDITNSLHLPPAFERSISRAIFHPRPSLSIKISSVSGDCLQTHVFPPWKSASTVKGVRNNHVMPRPFWRNFNRHKKNVMPKMLPPDNGVMALPPIS